MLKLGFVCSVVALSLTVLGCGEEDKQPVQESTLCAEQQARVMTECGITLPGSGTSDAGVSCMGQALCFATCSQNAPCADIMAATQLMGPLLSCFASCFQQPSS